RGIEDPARRRLEVVGHHARLYYRHGVVANDFEAPPSRVLYPSPESYSLEELGGRGDETRSAEEVFHALPEAVRRVHAQNGIVHVDAGENPFGAGRHLIVFSEPEPE